MNEQEPKHKKHTRGIMIALVLSIIVLFATVAILGYTLFNINKSYKNDKDKPIATPSAVPTPSEAPIKSTLDSTTEKLIPYMLTNKNVTDGYNEETIAYAIAYYVLSERSEQRICDEATQTYCVDITAEEMQAILSSFKNGESAKIENYGGKLDGLPITKILKTTTGYQFQYLPTGSIKVTNEKLISSDAKDGVITKTYSTICTLMGQKQESEIAVNTLTFSYNKDKKNYELTGNQYTQKATGYCESLS